MKSIHFRITAALICLSTPMIGTVAAQETADKPAVQRPAASSLTDDPRARAAIEAARDLTEEQSRDELIRSAQQRLQKLKGQKPTTITDQNTAAKPAAAPAAAPAPASAQQLIPEPVANSQRPPVSSSQPAPAPAPAATQTSQPQPRPSTPPPAAPPAPAPVQSSPPLAPGAVPPPMPLRPRYSQEKVQEGEMMEITSRESVMDNVNQMVTFDGEVFVDHPGFKIRSDHLEIYLNQRADKDAAAAPSNSKGNEPPFKKAIATGGMVEIERVGADGNRQIAKARRADYDAATGDIVLTGGPPTLQSGSGFINPTGNDAVIILKGNGLHEVKGGSGRNTIKIPLKTSGSQGAGGLGGLGGNLDSLTNRKQ